MKNISVLLIGTANSGKSTLFHLLTHKKVEIGNRAGVTVAEKRGKIRQGGKKDVSLTLFDLPGIYSLTPHTADEALTIQRLNEYEADVILCVIDSTALESGLSLVLEVRKSFPDVPTLLALNMTDELSSIGLKIDTDKLSRELSVQAISVCGANGHGIKELKQALYNTHKSKKIFACKMSARELAFSVLKRKDGESLKQSEYQDAMLSGNKITDTVDKLLLSRAFGIPVFFAIFGLLFFISFGKIGSAVSDTISIGIITPLQALAEAILTRFSAAPWLYSLISDGIITGVCAVLGFLPGILIFSLGLSLLEDSGYLSRVAFLFDAPLRRAGLSGRALIPILLGFGCTVSSVLSVRNLTGKKERRICTALLPLVSCSARTPLYLAFGASLFRGRGWMICLFLYILGISCFLLGLSILNSILKSKGAPPLAIELPKYRLPRIRVIALKLSSQFSHFLRRAGTVIFLSSVVTWLVSSFSTAFTFIDGEGESILLKFSGAISSFFAPLGFSDSRLVASLLSGLSAKESALSSLCILFNTPTVSLDMLISLGVLSVPSALSFIVFFSLYFPCFPAMTAIFEETKKLRTLLFVCLNCLAFAYTCAFITYKIAEFVL